MLRDLLEKAFFLVACTALVSMAAISLGLIIAGLIHITERSIEEYVTRKKDK